MPGRNVKRLFLRDGFGFRAALAMGYAKPFIAAYLAAIALLWFRDNEFRTARWTFADVLRLDAAELNRFALYFAAFVVPAGELDRLRDRILLDDIAWPEMHLCECHGFENSGLR